MANNVEIFIKLKDLTTAGISKAKWAIGEFGAACDIASEEADKLSKKLKGIGELGKVLSVGFGATVTALLAIGAAALKVSGDFEQYYISFKAMLGSATEAKTLLGDIQKFAQLTPFRLEDVVKGAKSLLAYNVEADKLIPTLKTLGSIAAVVGTEKMPQLVLAYGQVQAAQKLYGTELRQFTETGFPLIDELAKHFKVSTTAIRKMVEDGKVSFKDLEETLNSYANKNGNILDEQSKTFKGIINNILDSFTMLLKMVGDYLLPTFKIFADSLYKILTALQQMPTWLQRIVVVGGTLTFIVTGLGAALGVVLALLPLVSGGFATLGVAMNLAFFGIPALLTTIITGLGLLTAGLIAFFTARDLLSVKDPIKKLEDEIDSLMKKLKKKIENKNKRIQLGLAVELNEKEINEIKAKITKLKSELVKLQPQKKTSGGGSTVIVGESDADRKKRLDNIIRDNELKVKEQIKTNAYTIENEIKMWKELLKQENWFNDQSYTLKNKIVDLGIDLNKKTIKDAEDKIKKNKKAEKDRVDALINNEELAQADIKKVRDLSDQEELKRWQDFLNINKIVGDERVNIEKKIASLSENIRNKDFTSRKQQGEELVRYSASIGDRIGQMGSDLIRDELERTKAIEDIHKQHKDNMADIELNYNRSKEDLMLDFSRKEFKNDADREQGKIELNQRLQDLEITRQRSITDLDASTKEQLKQNEFDLGKTISKIVKQVLKSIIDAYVWAADARILAEAAALAIPTLGASYGVAAFEAAKMHAAGELAKGAIDAIPFAQGGQFQTAGTGYIPMAGGGMAMVGEAGSETITVTPKGQGRASGNTTIILKIGEKELARTVVESYNKGRNLNLVGKLRTD